MTPSLPPKIFQRILCMAPYVIDATKMPLNYARPLTKELDSRSLKM